MYSPIIDPPYPFTPSTKYYRTNPMTGQLEEYYPTFESTSPFKFDPVEAKLDKALLELEELNKNIKELIKAIKK